MLAQQHSQGLIVVGDGVVATRAERDGTASATGVSTSTTEALARVAEQVIGRVAECENGEAQVLQSLGRGVDVAATKCVTLLGGVCLVVAPFSRIWDR